MIAEMIIPIDTLRGQLRKDGYYFRMYKGKQIVQRCPNRKEHVKTANEQANQERFVERYRKKKNTWPRVLKESGLSLNLNFNNLYRAWANTRTITGTALIECYVLLYASPSQTLRSVYAGDPKKNAKLTLFINNLKP